MMRSFLPTRSPRLLAATALASLLALPALANDSAYPSQAEFYATAANQRQLELAQSNGALAQSREQMVAICVADIKSGKSSTQQCDCLKQELTKVEDAELFYASLRAYELFMRRAEAKQQGEAAYEALKAEHDQLPSLDKTLLQRCPL